MDSIQKWIFNLNPCNFATFSLKPLTNWKLNEEMDLKKKKENHEEQLEELHSTYQDNLNKVLSA